jgi:hypothetical protein
MKITSANPLASAVPSIFALANCARQINSGRVSQEVFNGNAFTSNIS